MLYANYISIFLSMLLKFSVLRAVSRYLNAMDLLIYIPCGQRKCIFYIVYPVTQIYNYLLCFCTLSSIPTLNVIYMLTLQYCRILCLSIYLPLPECCILWNGFVLLFIILLFQLEGPFSVFFVGQV